MTPHDALAAELAVVMDDRAARIVESWDAWRAEPWSFVEMQRFVEVMTEHVDDLRAELRAAGWEVARIS